jgi:phosphopentomutase
MMKRAIVIVLDSFGIGSLPDAEIFGDAGSNTLGHIDEYCYRNGISFNIPNLLGMGLGKAYETVNHKSLYTNVQKTMPIYTFSGAAKELSAGKDTSSGHWEMMCCPVLKDFGYFRDLKNSFPKELLNKIVDETSIAGYLGNCHASGTTIINELGDEHVKTLNPIFYTSADSVFQIAAHEEHFGLQKLYDLCEVVRGILAPYNIARVIARPFKGSNGKYERTKNRRDYSLKPQTPTALDVCKEQNGEVVAIGKIDDIYANQGVTQIIHAYGLSDLLQATIDAMNEYQQNKTIIMTNLVDFDMLYGHRRDILGYKTALELLDTKIPEIISNMVNGDLLIFTADHGCDPTWAGSDHTREHIPIFGALKLASKVGYKNIGIRNTFSDLGASVLFHLGLHNSTGIGESFINSQG